ncbi:MAG: nucleotidyltransferase substrate binding protein [Saprospiraceae bacterium]|jgi:nucleotidyltransferase substrate binding protein (TIGR01987 family)
MEQDIRWKQRFHNYEKSFHQLKEIMGRGELNDLEAQGLIKCFEYTYELAWNLMKDYLIYQGVTGITGSRDAIRHAFNQGLISEGELWMRMVDDRILTVHTYHEETAKRVEDHIKNDYFALFEALYHQMKARL